MVPTVRSGHERSPAGVYIYVFDHPEGKATVKCVCVYVCMCVCERAHASAISCTEGMLDVGSSRSLQSLGIRAHRPQSGLAVFREGRVGLVGFQKPSGDLQ